MTGSSVGVRELLIFVHVPKTAGTTLTRVLRRNQAPGATRRIANIFQGGGGILKPARYNRLVGRLRADPSSRLLHGHTPFGLDAHLPSEWKREYVTLLREPVDRAISHYYWLVDAAEDRPIWSRHPVLTPATPLEQALRGVHYVPDNLHTRMLCGLPEPFGAVTAEMLEQAKKNLQTRFAVFGLAERFDELLVLLKLRLGFRDVLYRSRRVNVARPRGPAIPQALVEEATRANRYDIELYRFAAELLREAPELDRSEFRAELAALTRARATLRFERPSSDWRWPRESVDGRFTPP